MQSTKLYGWIVIGLPICLLTDVWAASRFGLITNKTAMGIRVLIVETYVSLLVGKYPGVRWCLGQTLCLFNFVRIFFFLVVVVCKVTVSLDVPTSRV